MGLSRTVSEINGDFSRKLQIFPPRVFFTQAYMKRLPLELGTGARGQKTRMMELLSRKRSFDDIFSCLDTIHERDRQTDGHRATARTSLTQYA